MAVKEGRCTQATRMEYCAKLSENVNDDVAYELFKLCMQMDISEFKPQVLYKTDLHREQQSQHECALKAFLEAAQSGEYTFAEYGVAMPDVSGKPGWRYLTSPREVWPLQQQHRQHQIAGVGCEEIPRAGSQAG